MRVLAIDLGKTGCRGSLRDNGREIGIARGPGAPGLAFAGGLLAAEQAVRAVIAETSPTAFVLFVGAAGAAAAPDVAAELARRLAVSADSADSADSVAVTSDAVIAHAGALGGAPGVVLAIGTGAVATAVDEYGRFTRTDGWGPLLGDEGSGGWIGAEGVRAALRSFDGRGPHSVLQAAAADCYGVAVDALPALFGRHANPAQLAARFAPIVAGYASADAVAAAIVHAAADALARTVSATIVRSGMSAPVPFAITGGLAGLGRPLLDPLVSAVASHVDRRDPLGDPIEGAHLLATDPSTALEASVVRIDNY